MEKVGGMFGSDKLAAKGAQKREGAGEDGGYGGNGGSNDNY